MKNNKWMLIIGGAIALFLAYKFILPKLTGPKLPPPDAPVDIPLPPPTGA